MHLPVTKPITTYIKLQLFNYIVMPVIYITSAIWLCCQEVSGNWQSLLLLNLFCEEVYWNKYVHTLNICFRMAVVRIKFQK